MGFRCLAAGGGGRNSLQFSSRERRRSTDPAFILLESHPSPDKRFVLLVYHFDTGAFGYSRLWWAVTPTNYGGINLEPYELPDGYMGVGWAATGELEV